MSKKEKKSGISTIHIILICIFIGMCIGGTYLIRKKSLDKENEVIVRDLNGKTILDGQDGWKKMKDNSFMRIIKNGNIYYKQIVTANSKTQIDINSNTIVDGYYTTEDGTSFTPVII